MLTTAVRKIIPTFGYDMPDRAMLLHALEETKFTPDISKLEMYEWQLFFAPDELKKDHVKHALLGDDKQYKFPAFTQKGYHFWQANAPFDAPVAMETEPVNVSPFFPPVAKIKGEIYAIRPQRFLDLDRYRQNTVEYERQRVRFVVPYRKVLWLKDHNLDPSFGVQDEFSRSRYTGSSVTTSEERVAILRAWMYIGKPEFFDPLISAYTHSPVETFHAKNRRWCETYYNLRRPPLK